MNRVLDKTKLSFIIGISFSVFVVIGFLSVMMSSTHMEHMKHENEAVRGIELLGSINSNLREIVNNTVKYGYTGDISHRQQYQTNVDSIKQNIDELKMMKMDSSKVDSNFMEFEKSIDDLFIICGNVIAQPTPDFNHADWDRTIQSITAISQRIDEHLRILRSMTSMYVMENNEKAETSIRYMILIYIIGCIGGTTLFSVIYMLLRRELKERIKAEEGLFFQSQVLFNLIEAVLVIDHSGNIVFYNNAFKRLLRIEDSLLKKPLSSLASVLVPESFEVIKERTRLSKKWTGEFELKTTDGEILVTLLNVTQFHQGESAFTIAVFDDITEKKNLETRLNRAQRLESVGTLASGIAHDLNNVLSPILVGTQFLSERIGAGENRSMFEVIENSALRGAGILRQVLTFARGVEGEISPIRLKPIVREVESMLKETFPKNISLVFSIDDDLHLIRGDATQLHQMLLNLCINARDAMPGGGTLTVKVENQIVTETDQPLSIPCTPGQYVCLAIVDTGVGIQPTVMDKIFDPFFSTKDVGKGTGLGLSTVLGIIKSFKGYIDVESKPGAGATFHILLPACVGESVQSLGENAVVTNGNGELILVVDDEEPVRLFTSKILEEHGYRVIIASDGKSAMELAIQHQHELCGLITDVMMPHLDGKSLISNITVLIPSIRIIVMSGHLFDLEEIGDTDSQTVTFLSKPFTLPQLLSTATKVFLNPVA